MSRFRFSAERGPALFRDSTAVSWPGNLLFPEKVNPQATRSSAILTDTPAVRQFLLCSEKGDETRPSRRSIPIKFR